MLLAGDIPCENSLLRQVSSLLRRLPAIESEKFQDDFLMVSAFCSFWFLSSTFEFHIMQDRNILNYSIIESYRYVL